MAAESEVPKAVLTSALLIGHAGAKEADDGSQRSGYTAVLRDHAALQDFLRTRGCEIATGTICDTDLTKDDCLERIDAFFEDETSQLKVLAFLGNANQDGAWEFADDHFISFGDVWHSWEMGQGHSNHKLLIFSDTCNSGKLCSDALQRRVDNIFVQASSKGDEASLDHAFISLWLLVHQSPDSKADLLNNFTLQNQTTPTYYVPHGMSTKLEYGSLEVQLLGDDISLSQTVAPPNQQNTMACSKPVWQDDYDKLPTELQLKVAEMAQRDGWMQSGHFAEMIKLMCNMSQLEARRGGAEAFDPSDILEVLQEFMLDASLSADQALTKFREEFD